MGFKTDMEALHIKLKAIRLGWKEYTWEFGGDEKYGWAWAKKVYNQETAKQFLERMEQNK